MIVINDFYAKLDAGSKSAVAGEINRAEGFIAGRSVTQFFIANKIASNIIRKTSYGLVYKRFIKYSTTAILNVVMFQGMIEEAALASRRMQVKFPKTFYKIRGMNLDMAYFLVEGFLEPYLIYINSSSNQFCAGVNHELAKIFSCEVH